MLNIKDLILQHQSIFCFFNKVYLFGSSLDNKKYLNDIDLLLVYEKYSEQLVKERKNITSKLEKIFTLHIDLTILSETELKETNFLERLNSPYKRIL